MAEVAQFSWWLGRLVQCPVCGNIVRLTKEDGANIRVCKGHDDGAVYIVSCRSMVARATSLGTQEEACGTDVHFSKDKKTRYIVPKL